MISEKELSDIDRSTVFFPMISADIVSKLIKEIRRLRADNRGKLSTDERESIRATLDVILAGGGMENNQAALSMAEKCGISLTASVARLPMVLDLNRLERERFYLVNDGVTREAQVLKIELPRQLNPGHTYELGPLSHEPIGDAIARRLADGWVEGDLRINVDFKKG